MRGTFANVRLRNLLAPGHRGRGDPAPARRRRRPPSTTRPCSTPTRACRWSCWPAASTGRAAAATGRPRARPCSACAPSSPRASSASTAPTSSAWASSRCSSTRATRPQSLGLTGHERFSITGLDVLNEGELPKELTVTATADDDSVTEFRVIGAHRHADGGRVLPPRRHPAVRAAPDGGLTPQRQSSAVEGGQHLLGRPAPPRLGEQLAHERRGRLARARTRQPRRLLPHHSSSTAAGELGAVGGHLVLADEDVDTPALRAAWWRRSSRRRGTRSCRGAVPRPSPAATGRGAGRWLGATRPSAGDRPSRPGATKRRTMPSPARLTCATSDARRKTPGGRCGPQCADQAGRHLHVELQAVGAGADPEGLVLVGVVAGQAHRALRAGRRCRRASARTGSGVGAGPNTGSSMAVRRQVDLADAAFGRRSLRSPRRPRAAASCWAPRQTPSTGRPASTAARSSARSSARARRGRRARSSGRPSRRAPPCRATAAGGGTASPRSMRTTRQVGAGVARRRGRSRPGPRRPRAGPAARGRRRPWRLRGCG